MSPPSHRRNAIAGGHGIVFTILILVTLLGASTDAAAASGLVRTAEGTPLANTGRRGLLDRDEPEKPKTTRVWPLGVSFAFESEKCLSSTLDVATAFARGSLVPQCVDNNIIVRVSAGIPTSTKDDLLAGSFGFFQRFNRSSMFWSYSVNPSKYLRIGSPLHLGNYNEFQAGSNGSSFGNADFDGLKYKSTYVALMEQIGYGSSDINPKVPHVFIFSKRPLTGRFPPPDFIPTWGNVATYFTNYVRAFGGRQYQNFAIETGVTAILRNTSFGDLTGCKTQCTYEDALFGAPNNPNWTSITINGVRNLTTGQCELPISSRLPTGYYPGRLVLSEPSALNAYDNACSPAFVMWRDVFGGGVGGTCRNANNATCAKAVAVQMAAAYKNATSFLSKAIIFRAYLLSSFAGSYNSLFSGDGLTYTGNGGLLSATGQEIVTGYMDAQTILDDVKYVFFCPYDANGNPNPGGRCPSSLGNCTVCKGNEVNLR